MARGGPNAIDKYVGNRVREGRKALGMTQQKLAESLGLTFQQVQKYEKGTNRLGASRLQQVANALKVPITFFFEGAVSQPKISNKTPSPDGLFEFLATTEGSTLMQAFLRLPQGNIRRIVVSLVEEIAGRE